MGYHKEGKEILEVTHHSVELNWGVQPPTKRINYKVKYAINKENKDFKVLYEGHATKKLFDDLFSDTEYIFLIVTETQDGKPESRACYVKTLKAPVTAYDLHRAIAKQDPSEVEDILEKNSHLVDVPDRNEVSPLMKATNLGCTDIVEILLKYDGDPFQATRGGKSLISTACYHGRLEILKLLHKYDKNLWRKCSENDIRPLHWAVDGGSLRLVSWMILNGINVDEIDSDTGWTPLLRLANLGGNLRIAKALIRHEANTNVTDKKGCSVLMTASLNGHDGLVRLLLDHGADPNHESVYGKTAWDFAIGFERSKVIEVFREKLGHDWLHERNIRKKRMKKAI